MQRADNVQVADDSRMKKKCIEHQKYYFACQELMRADKFLSYIVANKLHSLMPRGNKLLQQEAFTISFIITYVKPFTANGHFGELSFKRNQYSEEEIKIHNKMKDLRNKAFAHIDPTIHNVERHSGFDLLTSPPIAIAEHECALLKRMIERQLMEIRLKLAELAPHARIFGT